MTRQSWHWLSLLTVMGLLGALLTAPLAQAQGDIEAVRAAVQGWLLQTLGKPGLTLVEYTYSYNVLAGLQPGLPGSRSADHAGARLRDTAGRSRSTTWCAMKCTAA